MNSLVLLYGIVDFYARHLQSSEIIAIEDGNVKVLVDRNKLSKADRKILDDFFKILHYLAWLPDESYEAIKQKWMKVLKGVNEFKGIQNGYAAVIVGLTLLDAYTKLRTRELKIHPKRVEKIMNLIKKEAKTEWGGEFRYLDDVIVESIEWGNKILKQMGVEDVRKNP